MVANKVDYFLRIVALAEVMRTYVWFVGAANVRFVGVYHISRSCLAPCHSKGFRLFLASSFSFLSLACAYRLVVCADE